ncbi:MAG: fimbrial protein [Muribaculaceae bacterium]
MKLQNIILALSAMLLLLSCSKEDATLVTGGEDNSVQIYVHAADATIVETRSATSDSEKQLKSLEVLVFDGGESTSKLIEKVSAKVNGSSISAALTDYDKSCSVLLLANATNIINRALVTTPALFDPATATLESISSKLTLGTVAQTLKTLPLPMVSTAITLSGISGTTTLGTVEKPIELRNVVSKISVTAPATSLIVDGVSLLDAPSEGGKLIYLAGENQTPSYDAASRINYFGTAASPVFEAGETVYMFPHENTTSATSAYLIVKGRYAGDAVATYYRIELSQPQADGSPRVKFNFQPNFHYAVNFTRVSTRGYATLQEALDNPASNLEYEINMGDLTDVITNGQYYISVINAGLPANPNEKTHVIGTVYTDAPASAKRKIEVISGLGVTLQETTFTGGSTGVDISAYIGTETCIATVRVTVGNISQNINIDLAPYFNVEGSNYIQLQAGGGDSKNETYTIKTNGKWKWEYQPDNVIFIDNNSGPAVDTWHEPGSYTLNLTVHYESALSGGNRFRFLSDRGEQFIVEIDLQW